MPTTDSYNWVRRIPDMPWMPAKHWNDTPIFREEPDLLVLHSGSAHDNVAEYERDTGQVEYTNRASGEKHIVLTCYHVAFSREHQDYVQQVELCCESWHAGGSLWRGQGHTNAHSVGLAMPGPAADVRPQQLLDKTVLAATRILICRPSLQYWCRHSNIDLGKMDPGYGVPNSIFDGLLEYAPLRRKF